MATDAVSMSFREQVTRRLRNIQRMGATHLTDEVIWEVVAEEVANLKAGKVHIHLTGVSGSGGTVGGAGSSSHPGFSGDGTSFKPVTPRDSAEDDEEDEDGFK